jgi:hypothetical protein
MKKSNARAGRQTRSRKLQDTDSPVRIVRVNKDDDLKTLYAKSKAAFTAADLQRYTQDDPMFPAELLVKELEAIHREETRKRKLRKARK